MRTKLSVKSKETHPAEKKKDKISIQVTQTVESTTAGTDVMTATPETAAEKTDEPKVDASDAIFAFQDVRMKTWTAQRESIKAHLKFFQQTRAREAGTNELSYYLRSKLISNIAQQELMPDEMDRISDEEMSLIITRSVALSTKALTAAKPVTPPTIPLTRATVDSDSGQPASEPYYEVMDTAEDDATELSAADTTGSSLAIRNSADQEQATPPRRGSTPPRAQRTSSSSRSTRRESGSRTIMRKPGYKSQHYKYSIPKNSKSKPAKTARSREDRRSRSRSTSRETPPRSSTPRGHSKRKESKRRGAGK